MKRLILIIFLCLGFVACRNNAPVREVLLSAGDNKTELKKVINHYTKQESDSLKHRAALFLIKNMPYHYSLSEIPFDSVQDIFTSIMKLRTEQSLITEDEKVIIADAVLYSKRFHGDHEIRMDHQTIDADYLINNIEWAFMAWEASIWKQQVSFNDFCEYVLPYRVLTEPVCYWRGEIYNRLLPLIAADTIHTQVAYLDKHLNSTYFQLDGDKKFIGKIPFQMNFKQLEVSNSGICPQRCAYVINHLRAMGIPATYDYIPNWGNRSLDHSMVGLASREQQVYPLLSNKNQQLDAGNNISSAQSTFSPLDYEADELPKGLYIQYNKTIPKVYRRTWSIQDEMKSIYDIANEEEIYPSLYSLTMKDVTAEYVDTATVNLKLEEISDQLVYLAVFETTGWIPIAVAKADERGTVRFDQVGTNIVYLPVIMNNNKVVPVAEPFLLTLVGEVRLLIPDHSINQTMKLIRKYPFFANTAQFPRYFKGGWFELSNSPDFQPAVNVHKVDYASFFMNTVDLNMADSYRYVRYCPPINGRSDVAEFEIWGIKVSDTVKFKGEPIGTDSEKENLALAFDGNYETYFRPWGRDRWVGLDLGKKNKITKIRFCPRNGANCVIPGYNYELMVWQNDQWNTLGQQTAHRDYIIYENVPTGGLYWLRCLTGGTEERIFTYENEGQIWW